MTNSVAAFTDTYLPTVNGVTYTIKGWRDRWNREFGRMDVVFPGSEGYEPETTEHPVRSVAFPFYEGYRLGAPRVPETLGDADVIHAHTPFAIGLAALRLAGRNDTPLVASYHTPTGEYADYLAPTDRIAGGLRRLTESYERWFYDHADVVLTPSTPTRDHLVEQVGVSAPVRVVSNGVDTDFFRPVDPAAFRDRYDLEGTVLGYTGRHGYEKRLDDLLAAADRLGEVTVVFGGDGPAREDLEERAREIDADVRFLGFLEREELPAFYSALDVFAFPSPVETQGLVALEANACGTPVVGADAGALSNTVVDGETGYHYEAGDVEDFARAIEDALADRDALAETCLDRRESVSVENVIETLRDVYGTVA